MYTALIVDDEKPQQELLTWLLINFPQIELLGSCSSVSEGVEKIKLLKPQLVFLDVMMPPQTGFDLLKSAEHLYFEVIFITSYEKFALQALRVSAVDYLLKPYSSEDLRIAIEKFEQRIVHKNSYEHIKALLHNVSGNLAAKTKIALPTHLGFMFTEIGNIMYCESDNSYCKFYFAEFG